MKKRLLIVLLAIAMVFSMVPQVSTAAVYADEGITGSGTEEDPYLISTEAGLRTYAGYASQDNFSGYAKLTDDIALTGSWTAIKVQYATAAFQGTFDGGGHTIRNLNVSGTGEQGFFGMVYGGTIKNLIVEGSVSSTNNCAGGIVGKLCYGTIENCSFRGTVTTPTSANNGYAGGITGYEGYSGKATMTSLVSGCSNYGTVEGKYAGGITGYAKYGDITDSYNSGNVSGTNRSAGIVGQAQNNVTITNCYNIGENNGTSTSKADIADFLYTSAKIVNCYYTSAANGGGTGTVEGGGVIDKDTLLADLGDAFTADSNGINNGYPILQWEAGGEVVPHDPEVVITGNTDIYLPNSNSYPSAELKAKASNFQADPEIQWSVTEGEDVISTSPSDDPNGIIVNPLKPGKAKIRATASGTEYFAESEINVFPFITTVEWQSGSPQPGSTFSVKVNVYGGGEYDLDNYPSLPSISWKYYDGASGNDGETAVSGTGTEITVPEEAVGKYLYASFMYNGETKAPSRRIQVNDKVKVVGVSVEGKDVTETEEGYEIMSGTELRAVALGEGGNTPSNVTYQWQKKGGEEFSDIEGAISQTFTADDSPSSMGTVYRVIARGDLDSSAVSKPIEITELSDKAHDEEYLEGVAESYSLGVLVPECGVDTNIAQYLENDIARKQFTGVTVSVKSVEKRAYPNGGEAAIAEDGTITYFYYDPARVNEAPISNSPYGQFDVTFTLKKGEAEKDLEKVVNVYWDTDRLAAYLQTEILDKTTWDTIKKDNTEENVALTDLTLPQYPSTPDTKLIHLDWASDNDDAITIKDPTGTPDEVVYGAKTGQVKRGMEDKTAVLTLSLTYNGLNSSVNWEKKALEELSKDFTITVPKFTDEEIHQMVLDDLEAKLAAGLADPGLRDYYTGSPIDPEAVTGDIKFPTTRDFGVDGSLQPVTITTDNTEVIDYPRSKDDPTKPQNNAARVYVYRPAPGEDPVTVTITVTITDKETGVSVSKDITVTVLPLTQEELDDAAALMDKAVEGYWDGIRFNNTDKGDIKSDLRPFYEINQGSEGELTFIHDPYTSIGNGVSPDTYVENPDGSNDADYRRFNVSPNPCIASDSLILVEPDPERTVRVTIDSYLNHEIYGEYYAKYMEEGNTEKAELYKDFYRRHAEVEVVVKGEDEARILRLAGSDRFQTAIAAADHLKEKSGVASFDNIIIASALDYPDALSATYLAYKKDAPVLLVGKDKGSIQKVTGYVNDNLSDEGTVYIIGGTGAVTEDVDKALDSEAKRLQGTDRYATNIAVLEEAGVDGADLLVACGTNYADALSASAAGRPILLVGSSLTKAQKDFLDSKKDDLSGKAYMIGGTAVVSDDIQAAIEGYFPETARLYGKDRYATSSAVANEFFKGTLDTVVIASGKDFPDGLAGGPVACAYKAPVVLVADGFYDHAKDFFTEHNAYRLIVMGGKGVISETTSEAIAYPATE